MFSPELFAARLVETRKAKKILAKDIATALGITKVTVSQYEHGTALPSLKSLVMLADVLDVSTDYLAGRSDVPERR